MRTLIFIILVMVTFLGCGVESKSSPSLSSSINTGSDGTDSNGTDSNDTDSNETDSNETDPDPSETELTLFSSNPSEAAQDVATDSNVTVTFNNSLDATTVDEASFSFTKDGSDVLFSVIEHSENVVTLKSNEVMDFDTSYVVAINSSLKDIYGNSISNTSSISFTTASEVPVVVIPSVYDPKACGAVDYYGMADNSFYPASTFNDEYGLGVTSMYPRAFTVAESEVVLFYPSVLENELDTTFADIYVGTNDYSFTFDRVWVQNSNRTVYIKTPLDANDEYKCYRYELNSTNASELKAVLVHRD